MKYRLFVQCPGCLQYFPQNEAQLNDDGSYQFPLHTCFIGEVPVPSSLVKVLRPTWEAQQQLEDWELATPDREPF